MEYVIGIFLILTFFGLAWYCVKGHNLMIGFLIMSVLWGILPLVGTLFVSQAFIDANPILQFGAGTDVTLMNNIVRIFQASSEGWGPILVNVLWGAWFGRVMMETGIASTIIRKTVELGGDKPMITIALLNIVVAGIFTTMMGAGPVISIGVIVLPILMSLGIPKALALFTFVGSVSAGMFINPVLQGQIRGFFPGIGELEGFTQFLTSNFSLYAIAITVITVTVMSGIYLKFSRKSHAWAAQTGGAQVQQNAPFYTLILPVVPVILHIWLGFPVIAGFITAGFAGLFLCGKMGGGFKNSCQLVNKMYFDGVVDTAPLIGFLLVLPMFNTAANFASPYFSAVIGPIMPTSETTVLILFAIVMGMGLFRGPMTLFGCGAATLGVLLNVGDFSVPFLLVAFSIPTIIANIGSCITQSWNAWGLAYTKVESKDFLKYSIPFLYVAGILLFILAAFTVTGLGPEWFL
ncbi:MAG: citrate transporter [Oscillospiraceae bacterium]|nr:citrate transporter [Oscillospiraceae bacterium]